MSIKKAIDQNTSLRGTLDQLPRKERLVVVCAILHHLARAELEEELVELIAEVCTRIEAELEAYEVSFAYDLEAIEPLEERMAKFSEELLKGAEELLDEAEKAVPPPKLVTMPIPDDDDESAN